MTPSEMIDELWKLIQLNPSPTKEDVKVEVEQMLETLDSQLKEMTDITIALSAQLKKTEETIERRDADLVTAVRMNGEQAAQLARAEQAIGKRELRIVNGQLEMKQALEERSALVQAARAEATEACRNARETLGEEINQVNCEKALLERRVKDQREELDIFKQQAIKKGFAEEYLDDGTVLRWRWKGGKK